jgi:hypothetical protein
VLIDPGAISARNAMSFRAIGILLCGSLLVFAATTIIFMRDAAAARRPHKSSYGQKDLRSIQEEVDQAAKRGHYNGYHTRPVVHH